jgi:oligoribonuclease
MAAKPLDFYDGPLVWVDCEMTGLDPRRDKILEIAVRVARGIEMQKLALHSPIGVNN